MRIAPRPSATKRGEPKPSRRAREPTRFARLSKAVSTVTARSWRPGVANGEPLDLAVCPENAEIARLPTSGLVPRLSRVWECEPLRNRPGIRSRSSGRFTWVAGAKPDFGPACPGCGGPPGHAAPRSALPRPPGDRSREVHSDLFLSHAPA